MAFYDEENDNKPTSSQKVALKKSIVDSIQEIGLTLTNLEETRSKKDFNAYKIEYEGIDSLENDIMRDHLLIETFVFLKPFPCSNEKFCSYIGEYLQQESDELKKWIEQYELTPFFIKTQSLERTFTDKIFAVCDYFESNQTQRHSRHLYDIHKIWISKKAEKKSLPSLFNIVALERRKGKKELNPSAQIGYELSMKFNSIIDNHFYKDDYESITHGLFYPNQKVNYAEIIHSLNEIIESGILPKIITE